MPFLSLHKDELALLRLTCDLFFVEESPLFFLDNSNGDSAEIDFEPLYKRLIKKGVIDPAGFRVTDRALNRLAPVTECDAQVVHIHERPGLQTQTDFFVLDEISVRFDCTDDTFLFGDDLDPIELRAFFGRRIVPSKSITNTLVDLTLSHQAFLALSRILQSPTPERLSRGALNSFANPRHDAPAFLGTLFPFAPPESGFDDSIKELRRKGIIEKHGHIFSLSNAFIEVSRQAELKNARDVFVRTEFGDAHKTRHASLVHLDGGVLALEYSARGVTIKELDGETLKLFLDRTIGPTSHTLELPPRRLLRQLLNRDDDDETERDHRPLLESSP